MFPPRNTQIEYEQLLKQDELLALLRLAEQLTLVEPRLED